MIYKNVQKENYQNQFSSSLKELQIGKLMRKSNITKSSGISDSKIQILSFQLFLPETDVVPIYHDLKYHRLPRQ